MEYILAFKDPRMSGLHGNAEPRKSNRPNIGNPPSRYGHDDGAIGAATTKARKANSKASSTGRRSEVEAERDEAIHQNTEDYAEKVRQSDILKVRINSTNKRLEAAKKKMNSTPNPTSQGLIEQLEDDLIKLEEEQLLNAADLRKTEMVQKDHLKAINSKFQAQLDQIASDNEEDEEEDNHWRTAQWAETQQVNQITDIFGQPVPPPMPTYQAPEPYGGNMEVYKSNPPAPIATADPFSTAAPMTRHVVFEEREAPRDPPRRLGKRFNGNEADAEADEEDETMEKMATMFGKAIGQALGGSRAQHGGSRSGLDYSLPKFNGNPGDWENFKAEYRRTHTKYQDSENICRLRSSLGGDAFHAVKHLMANPNNIRKILTSLQERFGRPEHVLDYLVEQAKATKSPDPSKPQTLIEFGTAVEALYTNVCAYNEVDYLGNRQLVTELAGKLPTSLQREWHRWLLTDLKRKPNLTYFAEWLSVEVRVAIMAVKPKVSAELKEEERRRGRNRAHGIVNIVTGEHEADQCSCCGKANHSTEKCWKFQKITTKERWDLAKEKELCLCCLKQGHKSKKCPVAAKCPKDGCTHFHNILLHSDQRNKNFGKRNNWRNNEEHEEFVQNPAATPDPADKNGHFNATIIRGTDGPLQILPVKIRKPDGSGYVKVHAFLDSGATCSLMLKSLADDLGLDGEQIGSYQFSGINGETTTVEKAVKLQCEVSGVGAGSKYHKCYGVMTVDAIPLHPYSFDAEEAVKQWPHLKRLLGKSVTRVVPQLIIGNNNATVYPRRIIGGKDGEPCAVKTVFGWTAGGNFGGDGKGNINYAAGAGEALDDYLHHLIKSSFTVEDFGVKILQSKGSSLDEKRAYRILEETSKKVNTCWEVGLLWREDNITMPDGERDAFTRLLYTERKMKDPIFKNKYLDKIQEYLQKGYLRKLTQEEVTRRPPHTKYIPHFGQVNPNKPEKFRFIMDAKAKSGGVALNDKLLKGPDLIRPLAAVLWNFRVHQIALTGDIADMFHRVRIRKEDTCSQRILWRDGDPNKAADHYEMEVMIFGATSSPSSAIYIKNKNAEDWKDKYPLAAAVVTDDYYVDDMLSGGANVEEVIQLRKQISEIMDSGSFKLCKFLSNSKQVLASIPDDLRAAGVKGLQDKEECTGERVLGLWWDPSPAEDNFRFKLTMHKVKQRILDGEIPTKREMCGVIMSLYDPLGFISQFKIKGLMLLQEVWRVGVGWDDEIPKSIHERWQRWLKQMADIVNVRVPRCYSRILHEADDVQLHIFQDASEESFACVCYLRIRKGNIVVVALVGSKAKVAPLKKLTIPKLELLAALLGCRLAKTLREELRIKISSRWFWSDSRTVLLWLRSTGVRYKEFVANRVGEIQEDTDASEWHWVPTKLNVADQATRFESEISFSPDSEWYNGPAFLRLEESEFPTEEKLEPSVVSVAYGEGIEDDYDVKPVKKECRESVVVPVPQRFSTYLRLLRATAATIKVAEYWLAKEKRKIPAPFTPALQSTLDDSDLKKAERFLIKLHQHEAFPEEVECLKEKRPINKKSSIWRLGPIMDADNIIRLDGRIGRANAEDNVKFPIILSAKHYITDLIIDAEHANCAHQGVDTVLCNLRQNYWIVEGRKAVQRSWSRCQMCRLKKVKPIPPRMASLPYF